MSGEFFLDTNIGLYLLDSNGAKKTTAQTLLAAGPIISPQVIFESLNASQRKLGLTKTQAMFFIRDLVSRSQLIHDSDETLWHALRLYEAHSFQVYDARIVASALTGGCTTLYSEDLQHGFLVDGKLQIVNPFLI